MKLSDKKFRFICYAGISLIVAGIFLFSGTLVYFTDVLWQYNAAASIVDGLLPYKDYNMVTTPLYYFISALFLLIHKSFGMKLFVDYVLVVITDILLFETIRLFTDSKIRMISGTLLGIMAINFGMAYNTMLLAIGLGIILIQKDSKDIGWKKAVLLGVLAACAILTKQTVGTLMAIAEIVYICAMQSKHDKIIFISSGMSVGLIFVLYLIITGSLQGFWDYCVAGTVSFKDNTAWAVNVIPILLLSAVGLIIAANQYNKRRDKLVMQFMVLNIILFMLIYPIYDFFHIECAAALSFAGICIWGFQGSVKSVFQKIVKCLMIMGLIAEGIYMCCLNIIGFGLSYENLICNSMQVHVTKSNTVTRGVESINKIESKYQRNVTVVSSINGAISYFRGEHNGVFDLFLRGNLGTKTPEEWIDEAANKGDIIAVYDEDLEPNYQFPFGVHDYIADNYTLLERSDYARMSYYIKE